MKACGRHLLVEYRGCDRELLDNRDFIERLMRRAAEAAGATVVAAVFHPFAPQGVTGVVVVEESHLSIHTWPEHGYAAVDFFTCGECEPERAFHLLFGELEAAEAELMHVDRGLDPPPQRSMAVRSHTRRTAETMKLVDDPTALQPKGPISAPRPGLRQSFRRN